MKKKTIIIIVAVVAVLAALSPFAYKKINEYLAEQALIKSYKEYVESNRVFYPNSYLNGIEISGMDLDAVVYEFETAFNSGEVKIIPSRTNPEESYSYYNLNTEFTGFESYIADAYENQSYTIEEFSGEAETEVKEYAYDLMSDVNFENADFSKLKVTNASICQAPEDAYVTVDVLSGTTEIVEETDGVLADEVRVKTKLIDAIKNGDDSITIEDADYVQPEITKDSEELVEIESYYNNVLNKNISIGVCGLFEYLDTKTIRSFLTYNNGLVVDTEALGAYIDGLKANYDSYGGNYVFNTSMGYPVALDYGNYGWQIDKEATVSALSTAILKNDTEGWMECEYTHTCSRPTNALQGNSYVEVSLNYQKIWMYINGELVVYDDITSGDITTPESATYTGFFHVGEMKTEVYLKGPTWYDFVHYWVLFDDPHANGFHDATWREDWEFGGENRNGNGSHGCVNLRLETAATIYNNLTMDMPIIVW